MDVVGTIHFGHVCSITFGFTVYLSSQNQDSIAQHPARPFVFGYDGLTAPPSSHSIATTLIETNDPPHWDATASHHKYRRSSDALLSVVFV